MAKRALIYLAYIYQRTYNLQLSTKLSDEWLSDSSYKNYLLTY